MKASVYDKKEIKKTVCVSDPVNWYDKSTITIKLFVCPPWKGKTDVRCYAESCDDFAMYLDFDCYDQACIQPTYDYMKKYIYDRMPEIISQEYLAEHGFRVF